MSTFAICMQCHEEFLTQTINYRYCDDCRREFGRFRNENGHQRNQVCPRRGRDRVSERLRIGFAMLNENRED